MGCSSSSAGVLEAAHTGALPCLLGTGDVRKRDPGCYRKTPPNRPRRPTQCMYCAESQMDLSASEDDPFASKLFTQYGRPNLSFASRIGYACRKVQKLGAANQDSWCIFEKDGRHSVYAVFDGHGERGEHVSEFTKNAFGDIFLRDRRFGTAHMRELLIDSFEEVQRSIAAAVSSQGLEAELSGTTASIVIHDRVARKLWVAHVGDSSVCIVRRAADATECQSSRSAMARLTQQHKPGLEAETKRIEAEGGRVVPDSDGIFRVYSKAEQLPGLSLSRSLGDLTGHAVAGLSAVPAVLEYDIGFDDRALILSTKTLWRCMSEADVVETILASGKGSAMQGAENLAQEASNRAIQLSSQHSVDTIVDDLTAICVYLPQ